MSQSGILVTVADARTAHLCVRGMREWALQHGFDFAEFVRHGLPVEKFEETGDAYALKVSQLARERAGDGK